MELIKLLKEIYHSDKSVFTAFILLFVPALLMLAVLFIQIVMEVYFNVQYIDTNTFSKIFLPVAVCMTLGILIMMLKLPTLRYSQSSSRPSDSSPSKVPKKSDSSTVNNPTTIIQKTSILSETISEKILISTPLKDSINIIKENFTNLGLVPIVTLEDSIYRSISNKLDIIKDQDKWRFLLPISISLLGTLIVINFDDSWSRFGLKGSQWLIFFVILLVCIVLYMSFLIVSSYQNRCTIDDIIEDIKKRSL